MPAAMDAGVNAVWFHMFQESRFDDCARWGLQPCVELATFRVDFERRPDLVPIGVDGRPIRYGSLVQGICLSHPEFVAEIEARIDDGLRTYRPAGVWLDYLSYAGWFETPEPDLQESCFCRACVSLFCESTGLDVTDPTRILDHHREAWTRHKCERIAALGLRFAQRIRAASPECLVGVYLCPWVHEHDDARRRIFAQDLVLLRPAVDVYTPLIYCRKCGRPPTWARVYLETSPTFVPGDRKLQLILDVEDFPDSLRSAARSTVPSWGVQIFGGSGIFETAEGARVFREAWAGSNT